MFLSEVDYFTGLCDSLFWKHKNEMLNAALKGNGSYSVPIEMIQVYDIVRHPNYVPNSYVDLNGVRASLERSNLTRGTNTQHYIKFNWRGFK